MKIHPGQAAQRFSGQHGAGQSGFIGGISAASHRLPAGSEPYDDGLVITVSASIVVCGLLATGHALAGLAAGLAPMPAFVRWAVLCAIMISLVFNGLRVARPGLAGSLRQLVVCPDGSVRVHRSDGVRMHGRVLASTSVSAWLTLLRLRLDGERFARCVPLAAGCCDPDTLRRLRVLLSWQVGPLLQRSTKRAADDRLN